MTRGRGIAVHSKICPNVENLLYEAERRIPVEWADATQATFPVRLRIFTEDRPGMLAGITAVISETGANIRTFESGGEDNTRARIEVASGRSRSKAIGAHSGRHQAHSRRLRYRARLQRLIPPQTVMLGLHVSAANLRLPAKFPRIK